MKEYKNLFITESPENDGDGLRIYGTDNPNVVENCVIDFTSQESNVLDENISFIKACKAEVKNCIFKGGIKLALCGNGQYPDLDKDGLVVFENCVFVDFGRRGVEAQDGISVIMKNCVILNWGISERFDVRNFASWAHSKSSIRLENCLFIQDKFWQGSLWQLIVDVANHIGNDINDRCLSWKSFIPGVCKGAFSTNRGFVECVNCSKNKWWIFLENSKGTKRLSEYEVDCIDSNVEKRIFRLAGAPV